MTRTTSGTRRIGGVLRRFPLAHRLAVRGWQVIQITRRKGQIERYLESHERRYLRLGSARHTDPGWLSVDFARGWSGVVFMDVTKPFPLPSGSFDAVQAEHLIEHISYDAGLAMLSECHRVLRSGGILRIATPNLALVPRLLSSGTSDPALKSYVEWSNGSWGSPEERRSVGNPVFTVNRLVRSFGHIFIYDEATLRDALIASGFRDVVTFASGDSMHPELRGIDRHHEEVGELANEIETLVLEGTA